MNTSKQINIMVALVFISVLVTGLYTLWDPGRAEEAEDHQLEATIRRGAYLFSANCRTCHGDAGEGGSDSNRLRAAPALNRPDLQGTVEDADGNPVRDDVEYAVDYKFVYYTITCGRVGKLMPAWAQAQGGTLNEEQIKQLTTFILNGDGTHEPEPAEDEGSGDEGEGEAVAQEEEEQTPWELAREYAQFGVEEFHIEGDNQLGLALTQPVSESDTELVLNMVAVVTVDDEGEESVSPIVNAAERLSIIDEDGEVVEIFLVTEVDAATNTVTVERGVGTTDAVAHATGTEVLKPPVPPEGQILENSCGQLAGAAQDETPLQPSTELSIIAEGTAWNRRTLSAVADAPLTITVQNNDEDIAHNWHITEGAEPGGDDIATTEIENGIVTQTLDFGPLPVGEYFYICDVHTNMEGVLTAYAPGTGPEGAAPGGGATTPAAGATTAPNPDSTTIAADDPTPAETPTP